MRGPCSACTRHSQRWAPARYRALPTACGWSGGAPAACAFSQLRALAIEKTGQEQDGTIRFRQVSHAVVDAPAVWTAGGKREGLATFHDENLASCQRDAVVRAADQLPTFHLGS